MAQPSKTQIDRLGDRLKKGPAEKSDLIMLDGYRRSFGPAYEHVVQVIRDQLKLEPSGRPAKSTNSLVEKLKRESIRLTQVQDIAGCRVVVADVSEQDRVVASLMSAYPGANNVVDRREQPSYAYRAVHVVVGGSGKSVEIQVRTTFQHIWAEISEKYADIYGSEIKYGGGSEDIRRILERMSGAIAKYEGLEAKCEGWVKALGQLRELDKINKIKEMQEAMRGLRKDIAEILNLEISRFEAEKGEKG
jgi:ppGpp synthetase/RelA/SpoT-type nucleotidyltranferase